MVPVTPTPTPGHRICACGKEVPVDLDKVRVRCGVCEPPFEHGQIHGNACWRPAAERPTHPDGSGHAEALIVIEGVPLTLGQSMALRVAVTSFLTDDEHLAALGVMGKLYKVRLDEVLALIFTGAR